MSFITVDIDPHSGFCFGVVYAIEMAEEILDRDGRLFCLGDIVHNDEEVARLQAKGLRIIDHADLAGLRDASVLIRAHGEPPATYAIALKNNLELIDASCPVVLKLQNRIRNSFSKGEPIYILGKPGHAEVEGLLGQTSGQAVVFQGPAELDMASLPPSLTLYSQTTKSTALFYESRRRMEEAGIVVNANDTICRQVSNRDAELRGFARRYDVILFVSGRKSSNGRVLFDACREVNARTHFVTSVIELDTNWFVAAERVGICGATSTPLWLMEEMREAVQGMAGLVGPRG